MFRKIATMTPKKAKWVQLPALAAGGLFCRTRMASGPGCWGRVYTEAAIV